jgi:hypothetical protein
VSSFLILSVNSYFGSQPFWRKSWFLPFSLNYSIFLNILINLNYHYHELNLFPVSILCSFRKEEVTETFNRSNKGLVRIVIQFPLLFLFPGHLDHRHVGLAASAVPVARLLRRSWAADEVSQDPAHELTPPRLLVASSSSIVWRLRRRGCACQLGSAGSVTATTCFPSALKLLLNWRLESRRCALAGNSKQLALRWVGPLRFRECVIWRCGG